MVLTQLGKEDFEKVWGIMEDSFPPSERREKERQYGLFEKKEYRIYGAVEADTLLGFLAVWDLGEFTFLEHFAVAQRARNRGLGGQMLGQLKEQKKRQIILEVELPEEELAQRRIRFYERNGFFYNEYPYMQPAMSADTEAIPLRIMSTVDHLTKAGYLAVREALYRMVYETEAEEGFL